MTAPIPGQPLVDGLWARLAVRRGSFELAVDFRVGRGRTLAMLGPNGAGKSTVLELLAGIIPVDRGEVRVNGRVLDDDRTHIPVEARRIGVVFQDYLLFPHLTVLDNVAFGPRAGGATRLEARASALNWLDRLGIADLAGSRPAQLSGGQAQRVAVARALASEPELLLLDEPLAALDVEVRDEVRTELRRHLDDWGGTSIIVTHTFEDVAALADDVVVIERGRVTQCAAVRELVNQPATPWVARLVSSWADD